MACACSVGTAAMDTVEIGGFLEFTSQPQDPVKDPEERQRGCPLASACTRPGTGVHPHTQEQECTCTYIQICELETGLSIKNICCPSRGYWFCFQRQYGCSQLNVSPVPGDPTLSSSLASTFVQMHRPSPLPTASSVNKDGRNGPGCFPSTHVR